MHIHQPYTRRLCMTRAGPCLHGPCRVPSMLDVCASLQSEWHMPWSTVVVPPAACCGIHTPAVCCSIFTCCNIDVGDTTLSRSKGLTELLPVPLANSAADRCAAAAEAAWPFAAGAAAAGPCRLCKTTEEGWHSLQLRLSRMQCG